MRDLRELISATSQLSLRTLRLRLYQLSNILSRSKLRLYHKFFNTYAAAGHCFFMARANCSAGSVFKTSFFVSHARRA